MVFTSSFGKTASDYYGIGQRTKYINYWSTLFNVYGKNIVPLFIILPQPLLCLYDWGNQPQFLKISHNKNGIPFPAVLKFKHFMFVCLSIFLSLFQVFLWLSLCNSFPFRKLKTSIFYIYKLMSFLFVCLFDLASLSVCCLYI